MKRLTLRARLTIAFALSVVVALGIFSVGVLSAVWLDEAAEHPPDSTADVAEIAADMERVLWAMLLAAPLGIGGAAAIGYVVAGRALSPLREAAQRARAARASALDLLLPTTGRGDEWDVLAETINGLLAAARTSMSRIQGFTADAAHELRTPLTAMIGEADVTLRRDRSPEELKTSLALVREEAVRLSEIVNSLLLLARADSAQLLEQRTPVDLLALARSVSDRWATIAKSSGRTVVVTGEDVTAAAAPSLLAQLLDNLLRNALAHGGGEIEVQVRAQDGRAELRVTDHGAGVPEAIAGSLFGRFVRGDPARSGGGVGLGLSLAAAIAEAHGGKLLLESARSPTRFLLTLPLGATS